MYKPSAKETGERPLAACGEGGGCSEGGGCLEGEGLHGDKSIIDQSINQPISQSANGGITQSDQKGGFPSDYTARTAPRGDSLVAVGSRGLGEGRLKMVVGIFFVVVIVCACFMCLRFLCVCLVDFFLFFNDFFFLCFCVRVSCCFFLLLCGEEI